MSSRRQFELLDDALQVTFSGALPAKTLRRRLTIPYDRVVSVSARPFDRRDGLLRAAGYALGNSLHGLFRRHGKWLFLSFEDPEEVVDVELDPRGARWPALSEVVLQVADPAALAARLTERAAAKVDAARGGSGA